MAPSRLDKQYADAFGTAIWSLVCAHQGCAATEANDLFRQNLRKSIVELLKKWSERPVKMVSTSVYALCSGKHDPFSLFWPKRTLFGSDTEGEPLLYFEHTTPLAWFADEHLLRCGSEQEVIDGLVSYSGVCCITREENARLDRKYRHERPGGWEACYLDVDIQVVHSPDKEPL